MRHACGYNTARPNHIPLSRSCETGKENYGEQPYRGHCRPHLRAQRTLPAYAGQNQQGTCGPCILYLEDGTIFYGRACGAEGTATGEVCFNTSLEGYFEVMTDPSYAGQIVTMTYPQIGNYGIDETDVQSAFPGRRRAPYERSGYARHDRSRHVRHAF